jgi:hypothetical protein
VWLQVDESKVTKSYANAFRADATPEEVMLDFGSNLVMAAAEKDGGTAVLSQIDQRIVMNHYSAERLALGLGQSVRQYEQDFGSLELDVNKRRKAAQR